MYVDTRQTPILLLAEEPLEPFVSGAPGNSRPHRRDTVELRSRSQHNEIGNIATKGRPSDRIRREVDVRLVDDECRGGVSVRRGYQILRVKDRAGWIVRVGDDDQSILVERCVDLFR
jgi:hypothetical protein